VKLAMIRSNPEVPARPAVVLSGQRVVWFQEILGSDAPTSLDAMITTGADPWLEQLRSRFLVGSYPGSTFGDMIFDAPISFRRNPLCIGRNYPDHAQEAVRSGLAKTVNEEFPMFFSKATTTLNHDQGGIVAFQAARRLDYEAELGVILSRGGREIDREHAESMILGYTLVNDVTAREVQQRHQQWFLGKSFDGFCPIGPVIVTRDEIPWPVALTLQLTVNGEERQRFHTQDMIFDIADQIRWLSQAMTLLPGDLLATGTGDGVGRSFTPPRYLHPGDQVEIVCSAIGRLRNWVVEE